MSALGTRPGTDADADADAVTLLHNPRCSTSRAALEALTGAGVDPTVVSYLEDRLDEPALRDLLDRLEDPVSDLVRRDAAFERAGLEESDVAHTEGVVAALLALPELMQRPVIIGGDRAFIGRPRSRVAAVLGPGGSGASGGSSG